MRIYLYDNIIYFIFALVNYNKPKFMKNTRSQIVMSPNDNVEYIHRMFRQAPLTDVNDRNCLTLNKFVHNTPIALHEAWNAFEDMRKLVKTPVYLRFVKRASAVDALSDVVHYLPSILKAFNNSRRMRRLGVSGARVANVFMRGSHFYYVSDSIFDSPYSAALVAFSLSNMAGALPLNQKLDVFLKHSETKHGRSIEQQIVGQFMRDLKERCRYLRGSVMVDPIGFYGVRITPDKGVSVGLLLTLLEDLSDQITTIHIGSQISLSFERLIEEDDYMETLAAGFRCFRFKYFTKFGDFYNV